LAAITEDVQRFITGHIESAEQLDLLMLLHAQQGRTWSAEEVSQAVFSVPQSVARSLERLAEHGLAASEGAPPAYRYAPGNAETDARVAAVAAAYRANRVEVVKLVFTPRADPVRSLADAFRLRKD
jgi:DNA-binding IclR family transcriptional regulator